MLGARSRGLPSLGVCHQGNLTGAFNTRANPRPHPATYLHGRSPTMAEFDAITASLRQQRRDLDELAEGTATRCEETAGLLKKIEELRRRAEKTRPKFEPPAK